MGKESRRRARSPPKLPRNEKHKLNWYNFVIRVFPSTLDNTSRTLCFLWIIGYILGALIFYHLMKPLWLTYRGNYVNTVISIETKNNRLFPTLTFCSANLVKKSRLSGYQELHQLGSMDLAEKFELLKDVYPESTCLHGGDEMFSDLRVESCAPPYDSVCIPAGWFCDGKPDCPTGSDEEDCPEAIDPNNIFFSTITSQVVCTERFNKCGELCLSTDDLCNERGLQEVCPSRWIYMCGREISSYSAPEVDNFFFGVAHWKSQEGPLYENKMYKNDKFMTNGFSVEEGYFTKFEFVTLALEDKKHGRCPDMFTISDTGSNPYMEPWSVCGIQKTPYTVNLTTTTFRLVMTSDVSEVDAGVELFMTICNATWCDLGPVAIPQPDPWDSQEVTYPPPDIDGGDGRKRRSPENTPPPIYIDYDDTIPPYIYFDFDDGSLPAEYEGDMVSNYTIDDWIEPKFQGLWRVALEQSMKVNFRDFTVLSRSFSKSLLEKESYHMEEVIIDSTFNHRDLETSENFRQVTTYDHGNCFLFNSIGPNQTQEDLNWIEKVGTPNGFIGTFFVNKDTTLNILTESPGIKMFITPAESKMLMSQSDSIFLRPGQKTTVGIKTFQIQRLAEEYSECISEWPDFVPPESQNDPYVESTCQHYCLNYRLQSQCNCQERFNEVQKYRQCNPWYTADRICRQQVYEDFFNPSGFCNSVCLQACDEEGFEYTMAYESWPNEDNVAYLIRRYLKSEPADSDFHKFLVGKILPVFDKPGVTEEDFVKVKQLFRDNVARVEVNYRDFNIQVITELPAYSTYDLIADFGGNLGLWMGWSMLVAVTFIEHIIKTFLIALNPNNYRREQPSLPTIAEGDNETDGRHEETRLEKIAY